MTPLLQGSCGSSVLRVQTAHRPTSNQSYGIGNEQFAHKPTWNEPVYPQPSLVPVTVYVPGRTTVIVAPVADPLIPPAGPVQLYVTVPPPGVTTAVRVNDSSVVQLRSPSVLQISTDGVGSTVIVKLFDGPAQPLAVGVTVMCATALAEPLLVAVKAAMSPLPLAAKPILVLSLVQPKVVPATALVK